MIEKVTKSNFDEVLGLIREYQQFYKVKEIEDEKNKIFFSQFADHNLNGVLHIYRCKDIAAGFMTIYRGYSSTRAEEVAILNDLYVSQNYRGKGYAKALIAHAVKVAKDRGFSRLQWLTSRTNIEAQRLYSSFGVNSSEWIFYTKEL